MVTKDTNNMFCTISIIMEVSNGDVFIQMLFQTLFAITCIIAYLTDIKLFISAILPHRCFISWNTSLMLHLYVSNYKIKMLFILLLLNKSVIKCLLTYITNFHQFVLFFYASQMVYSRMNRHVCTQMCCSFETFLTYITLMRPFIQMCFYHVFS